VRQIAPKQTTCAALLCPGAVAARKSRCQVGAPHHSVDLPDRAVSRSAIVAGVRFYCFILSLPCGGAWQLTLLPGACEASGTALRTQETAPSPFRDDATETVQFLLNKAAMVAEPGVSSAKASDRPLPPFATCGVALRRVLPYDPTVADALGPRWAPSGRGNSVLFILLPCLFDSHLITVVSFCCFFPSLAAPRTGTQEWSLRRGSLVVRHKRDEARLPSTSAPKGCFSRAPGESLLRPLASLFRDSVARPGHATGVAIKNYPARRRNWGRPPHGPSAAFPHRQDRYLILSIST